MSASTERLKVINCTGKRLYKRKKDNSSPPSTILRGQRHRVNAPLPRGGKRDEKDERYSSTKRDLL